MPAVTVKNPPFSKLTSEIPFSLIDTDPDFPPEEQWKIMQRFGKAIPELHAK